MFIYGHHPVLEALNGTRPLEKVYFQQDIRGEFEREVRHLCRVREIPMQVVPREKLNRLVKGAHQGIIAAVPLIEYMKIDQVLPFILEKGEIPLFVLLEGVTDVRNLGAIARSALVSGAHALVLPKNNSALLNEDAMKASAGALDRLPICRENSIGTAIDFLKLNGVQIVAADLADDIEPIYKIDLTMPTAILLGSEGEGLPTNLLKKCDFVAKIPQTAEFDSFNVGVAAGICLYETMRQRAAM
jgi:23S rRNA (guanosine2251-2'-O)-methyltransferase